MSAGQSRPPSVKRLRQSVLSFDTSHSASTASIPQTEVASISFCCTEDQPSCSQPAEETLSLDTVENKNESTAPVDDQVNDNCTIRCVATDIALNRTDALKRPSFTEQISQEIIW